MEIGILIPLILTILILLFAGVLQNRTFREKENCYKAQIQKIERSLIADRCAFETDRCAFETDRRAFDKERQTFLQNEKYLIGIISGKEGKIQYRIPPPELFSDNPYWNTLSFWLRREKRWYCEKCDINLVDRQKDLHVHHIFGKAHNSPQHLKVLCIECHAEEEGHDFMKRDATYTAFLEWKRRLKQRRIT